MPPGMQRPVFSLDGDIYTWQDVLAHAEATGAWSELEQAAREGVACELLADSGDEAVEEDAIEEAGEEFRYERDLVTATEMEAWLAEKEITAEEWMGHVRRSFLRVQWEERLAEIVEEQEPDEADVRRALEVDLAASGMDMELARRLAEDVAAASNVRAGRVGEAGGAGAVREGLGRDMTQLLDDAMAYREALLTDEAIEREVSAAHLDWIRLDCQALAFSDENEAREAALCLREDEEDLEELARDARIEPQEVGFYLSDLEPDRRALFLSARVGEVVGPIAEDDLYTLYQVTAKTLPTVDDPDVAQRARDAIVVRQLEIEVNHRIQWHAGVTSR